MAYAILPRALPPILTDAGWTFAFSFYGATVDQPDNTVEDWADASLAFAPVGGGTAYEFRKVAATGKPARLTSPEAYQVLAELTAADVEDWTPGPYVVELRRLEGADIDVRVAGQVFVATGASARTSGGPWVPPGSSAGTQGAAILQTATSVAVVQGEAAGAAARAAASADVALAAQTSAEAASATAVAALAAMTGATVKTANFPVLAGRRYLLDSSAGSFTATAPATLAAGDSFVIEDGAGACTANPVTLARNGHTIDGAAEDFRFDLDWASVRFTYNGATLIPRRY